MSASKLNMVIDVWMGSTGQNKEEEDEEDSANEEHDRVQDLLATTSDQ